MLLPRKNLVVFLLSLIFSATVVAESVIIPAPPQLAANGYLLIDANTGEVLVEQNADEQLAPASLTKMMTSYIVSSEIEAGRLRETDLVTISDDAWRRGGSASGGSTMFLDPRSKVSVSDLMRGVIIQSGNDASIALAQHIAGSEEAFAEVMNQQAALLGMNNSNFRNATGLPADDHYTTAKDLSLLARALINDFPEHYEVYSERYFSYNGINQPNRNKLLFTDNSVDGIKTGHTSEAGFCLVSSSEKNGMRLIAVVMGSKNEDTRADESRKLLAYGFRYYQTHQLYKPTDVVTESRIWAGVSDQLTLGVAKPIYVTIPRGAEDELQAEAHLDEVIKAPIQLGQELGNVTVSLNGEVILDEPLVAQQAIERAGFFARLWDAIKLFFINLFS